MLESFNQWFLSLGAQYGVNPYIFGGIYIAAIPFFLLSIAWLVRNARAGKSTLLPTMSAGFFFAGAYVAWTFVQVSMQAGDKAPVMYFVLWPLQLVIPYAFGSAGAKHLIFALHPALKPAQDKVR